MCWRVGEEDTAGLPKPGPFQRARARARAHTHTHTHITATARPMPGKMNMLFPCDAYLVSPVVCVCVCVCVCVVVVCVWCVCVVYVRVHTHIHTSIHACSCKLICVLGHSCPWSLSLTRKKLRNEKALVQVHSSIQRQNINTTPF